MKKFFGVYILIAVVLLFSANSFALDVPTMDEFNSLKSDVDSLKSTVNSNQDTVDELSASLSAMKADDKALLDKLNELGEKNTELLSSLDSLQEKIDSLGNGVNETSTKMSSLETELTEAKASMNSSLDETNAVVAELKAYVDEKKEAEKNNPLSGLFSLAETGALPIILGLLIVATLVVIVLGYGKFKLPELDLGKKDEKDNLTFVDDTKETKSLKELKSPPKLKEYSEDEPVSTAPKGKWATE